MQVGLYFRDELTKTSGNLSINRCFICVIHAIFFCFLKSIRFSIFLKGGLVQAFASGEFVVY